MGLVEIGGIMLSRAAQRVELCAQNLSNATTPGYKARSSFDALILQNTDTLPAAAPRADGIDFSSGALQSTGNPFDLAISGSGFFVVQGADGTSYTRDGQFSRDASGRLVTADGKVLQSTSGDLVVGPGEQKILPDGTVLNDGEPVGRLAIVSFANPAELRPVGGNQFAASAGLASPANAQIRQGMLEASNVSTAAEMIAIMSGLRGAGSGQKVVQLYDDLMGRAVSAFGQQ